MDPVREAFSMIKQDISDLHNEIISLKQQISELKQQETPTQTPTVAMNTPTIPTQTPTLLPTQTDTPTQTPTMDYLVEPLKQPNLPVSIGNGGVPTDKQTNRQTNQQTDNDTERFAQPMPIDPIDEFQRAQEVLDSLDNIKKSLRLKFKRLTPQEMLVFSTLYTFEDQNIDEITYKLLANNLNLSESSIRDYTNKLINKGIPIIKIRQNNKKIALRIAPDLKNITTLATINQLRNL
jgi:hypothetical protein